MSGTKKVGSSGRLGPRYGRKIRFKVRTVEKLEHSKQICPACGKPSIKRLAKGIFECRSCKTKVTGNAYTLE